MSRCRTLEQTASDLRGELEQQGGALADKLAAAERRAEQLAAQLQQVRLRPTTPGLSRIPSLERERSHFFASFLELNFTRRNELSLCADPSSFSESCEQDVVPHLEPLYHQCMAASAMRVMPPFSLYGFATVGRRKSCASP